MLSVFVVIELVNIFLLNVTATVVDTETLVELSVGLTEDIVGAVVSLMVNPFVVVYVLVSELLELSVAEVVILSL